MAKPKILFVHTLSSGVTYWRFINFVKYMKKSEDFEISIFPEYDVNVVHISEWELKFDSKDQEYYKYVCDLFESADILIFQAIHKYKVLGLIDALVNHAGKKIICESDDYIFGIPSDHTASSAFYPGSNIEDLQWKQMLVSQSMVVSTPYLKRMYDPWNRDIHVIPNAIDFELWKSKRRKKDAGGLRIGYVGGQQHNRDLYVLREVIPAICKSHEGVRFVIWGGHPDVFSEKYERIKKYCEFPQWERINKYPSAYAEKGFDIVISPLLDNALNRAKSNLKWLEASALKIPFVGSNVLPYKESIVQGETGFIIQDNKDWVQALSLLIKDPSLRKRMGENAYEEVKKNWNVEEVARQYLKVIKSVKNVSFRNTYKDLNVESNLERNFVNGSNYVN